MRDFVGSCGPVVCCATTAEAERIAAKNGPGGFCEMLEAFALMPATQAPLSKLTFRSASRHYMLVGGLRVRFIRASEMTPTSIDAAERLLHGAIRSREGETADLEALLEGSRNVRTELERRREAQWFDRWRSCLEQSLRFAEYEAFECPALCLLVVSTSEPTGIPAALRELSSARNLPQCFRTGQFDDRYTPKYVAIVHDVGEAGANSETTAREAIATARSVLPTLSRGGGPPFTLARLLPMNSLTEDLPDATEFKRLSSDDTAELNRFAREILHSGVVPSIERRVAALHASVSNSRKGVRNVLKSWLRRPRDFAHGAAAAVVGDSTQQQQPLDQPAGGATKSTVRDASLPAPKYPAETIEANIRLLADTAFAMRDHDTALGMYRLGRDDYKADRALGHLGSANEMIARCLFAMATAAVSDSSSTLSLRVTTDTGSPAPTSPSTEPRVVDTRVARRDAVAAIDAATQVLSQAAAEAREADAADNPPKPGSARRATRLARMLTRASLVAAEVHAAWPGELRQTPSSSMLHRRAGERSPAECAADALVSAAQFETNLNAAVLYEQAAWRYRSGKLERKSALHLVMAGHRYRACGEDVHAVECYIASRDAYRESYSRRRPAHEAAQARASFQDEFFQLGVDELGGFGGSGSGGVTMAQRRGVLGWGRIDEHVEHNLGRQLEALGYHALALRCTLSMLASARAPPDRHAALVRNFVSTCAARPEALQAAVEMLQQQQQQKSTSPADDVRAELVKPPKLSTTRLDNQLDAIVVLGLPLPLVVDEAVAARTSDEIHTDERLKWATDLAHELDVELRAVRDSTDCVGACVEDRRNRLERENADARFGGELLRTDVRKPHAGVDDTTRAARAAHWPRWCARAEAVEVDVVFKNTLAAPIDLTDVHLVCVVDVEHDFAKQPIGGDSIEDAPPALSSLDAQDEFLTELSALADAADKGQAEDAYAAERVHVTLPPGGGGAQGGALVRLRCGAASRRGTLRVVGVRWRLQGTVWGAHAFARRGPRLHRTRAERATEARAPDASLAFHIAGDTPKLSARLAIVDTASSGTQRWVASSLSLPRAAAENLLQGEVRRACLELTNVGRASAGQLRLRCSGPWLAVGPAANSLEDACSETAYASIVLGAARIGPSGLSWKGTTSDNVELELSRGQSVFLPLLVRARGAGGKEPLRLVVQYVPSWCARRPVEDALFQPRGWPPYPDDDGEAPSHAFVVSQATRTITPPDRVFRERTDGMLSRRASLSVEVCVLPALVAAVARPDPHAVRLDDSTADLVPRSIWSLEPNPADKAPSDNLLGVTPKFGSTTESLLSLQLTNYSSNGDLKVGSVHCVPIGGGYFTLADLDSGEAPAEVVDINQTVGWNEQLALHLSVVQHAEQRTTDVSDAAATLLEIERSHANFEAAVSARELEDLEQRDAPRHVSVIRRARQRQEEEDTVSKDEETTPSDSYFALVVSWKTADDRIGQYHVLSVKVADAARPSPTCPVSLVLDYPPSTKADFVVVGEHDGEYPALVPVVARLWNRMPPGSKPIVARLEALDDPDGFVHWLGLTIAYIRDFEPLATSKNVVLRAVVRQPGVYDLNLFRLTVFYEPIPDETFLTDLFPKGQTFLFNTPHVIVVAHETKQEDPPTEQGQLE